jgi:hypothetical protein
MTLNCNEKDVSLFYAIPFTFLDILNRKWELYFIDIIFPVAFHYITLIFSFGYLLKAKCNGLSFVSLIKIEK